MIRRLSDSSSSSSEDESSGFGGSVYPSFNASSLDHSLINPGKELNLSSSSSSEDESSGFGGSVHPGFNMGHRQVQSTSSSDHSLDSPRKKRNSSSSSSSKDERPGLGGSVHPGFNMGHCRIQSTSSSDHSLDSPRKKRNSCEDSDSSADKAIKKFRVHNMNEEAQNKGVRIMQKMGYKKGVGLGKHGQGRLEPVKASNHKGRRGLGHFIAKLKGENVQWDQNKEIVSVEDDIKWLNNSRKPIQTEALRTWIGLGLAKKKIEDEFLFCDRNVVTKVVNSKSIFDNVDKNEMRRARTRSNPYETIGTAFFQNRAAVKMANIDRACDFMFTEPQIWKRDELLYFADVCAGPGGFSEYVLWRRRWHAKGFGLTLKESNDFKLEDFWAGTPESFHPYYGPNGDGDIYNPENQEAFRDLIMRQTKNEGVHIMMADGGFSVEGQEKIQEILSKQLYLCQCLVALKIVRPGGNFVTKVFDLFTPFSAGLVYLMYRCFDSVSIFKPNTSRPANSERYLICKGKHQNVDNVIAHLARANQVLLEKNDNCDVVDLVPRHILEEDTQFFDYLKNSNDNLGKKQIIGLLKIAAFYEDASLFEPRQEEMRKRCLEYWEVPDTERIIPKYVNPDESLGFMINNSSLRFITSNPTELKTGNLEDTILNTPYDWYCMPCGSSKNSDDEKAATFYIGLEGTKTFRYSKGSWVLVRNLELPPDTLVYAEMILEFRGEKKAQTKTWALHILDAYMLGGEDISQKFLRERNEMIKLFCEALWKPTNSEFIRVRAKDLHSLSNNLDVKLRLKPCVMKDGTNAMAYVPMSSPSRYDNDGDGPYYYIPNSLLFFKGTARNWSRHLSRSTGYTYYFNCQDNTKLFDKDRPATANAGFPESIQNRVVWDWHGDPALPIEGILRVIKTRC